MTTIFAANRFCRPDMGAPHLSGASHFSTDALLARAELALQNHPAFRGRFDCVRCQDRGGTIELTGTVPSYYLKQLAQELLRHSLGNQLVENKIDVDCPCIEPGADTPIRIPR